MEKRYKIYAKIKEIQLEDYSNGNPSTRYCKLSMPKSVTDPDSDTKYNVLFKMDPANESQVLESEFSKAITIKEEVVFHFDQRFENIILDLHRSGRAAKFMVEKVKLKQDAAEKNETSTQTPEAVQLVIKRIILTGEQ